MTTTDVVDWLETASLFASDHPGNAQALWGHHHGDAVGAALLVPIKLG